MISRMITTVIATAPMFLTISVIVNSLPVVPPAAGLGLCKRNRRKPIAFVPRMVVRIVTVTPPKVFYYVDFLPAIRLWRRLAHPCGSKPAPDLLLRYKVVDDYAVDFHRLTGNCVRRDHVSVFIDQHLHLHRAGSVRAARNRRVWRRDEVDRFAIQHPT